MFISSPLADVLFWVAAACCIVAHVAILRSVLRSRRQTAANPDVPRSRQSVEIVWAIVPALVLAVVLAATWRSMHSPV